ncbi:MAG: hypothetical protein D6815_04475 [Candidatus Dadabacteria bacterium]|nr:MAG: hypothetical protein D6815_04475 [Candidatus Dadabacteria bacterium]
MKKRKVWAEAAGAAAVCLTLSLATGATAATVNVINADGPGEGFNDPTPVAPVGGNTGTTLGEQRFIAFEYAAKLWAARIGSNVTIEISATFDPLTCGQNGAVLGQAGPTTFLRDFSGAPRSATWYPILLANILGGKDFDPGRSDITAQFNSEIDSGCFSKVFYYGLDGNQGNGIDFVTVLMHELGHGLGFLTGVNPETGQKFSGFDDAFMLFLEDHSTGKTFPNMTDPERAAAAIDGGQTWSDLHWIGPNGVAAGSGLSAGVGAGGHLEMYAPDPVEQGSSLSHYAKTLSPNELMEPQFTTPLHTPERTLAVLADVGYPSILPCGDATGDGSIKATDALAALRASVGGAECLETVCDATGDGRVVATDALVILKRAVGQLSTIECGLRTS